MTQANIYKGTYAVKNKRRQNKQLLNHFLLCTVNNTKIQSQITLFYVLLRSRQLNGMDSLQLPLRPSEQTFTISRYFTKIIISESTSGNFNLVSTKSSSKTQLQTIGKKKIRPSFRSFKFSAIVMMVYWPLHVCLRGCLLETSALFTNTTRKQQHKVGKFSKLPDSYLSVFLHCLDVLFPRSLCWLHEL